MAKKSNTKKQVNRKKTQKKQMPKKQMSKKTIQKKQVQKNNNYRNIVRIAVCGVLLLLFIFIVNRITKNQRFFEVDNRHNEIEKYQKENDYTIVGWLKVQGTNIDYPVLFYDDAPISDVSKDIGWTYNKSSKLQYRTVIEGHNIMNMSSNPLIANKNSKRFEQLLSFYDPAFVKKNKYIEYFIKDKRYVFKIFAVGFPEIETYYIQNDFSKEEKKYYIDKALDDSLYKFNIDVDENDKIISLYTCTKFYGYTKAVVFRIDGRLLRKNEQMDNYNFSTTVNYDNAKKYSESIKKNQEVDS